MLLQIREVSELMTLQWDKNVLSRTATLSARVQTWAIPTKVVQSVCLPICWAKNTDLNLAKSHNGFISFIHSPLHS